MDALSGLWSSGSSVLSSGTKAAKSFARDNLGGYTQKEHVFRDNRDGSERAVQRVSKIAEGGFGAVFLVRDGRTGTEYALKKINCQEGVQVASTIEAAEAEAKILQKIPAHPNIVQCYGFVTEQSSPGCGLVKVLLELCTGGHLLDYMDKKDGKLTAKEIVGPMVCIVDAVLHMHSQSPPIQHRDLKVENVLLAGDGVWKLCDFGSCSTETVKPEELNDRKRKMRLQDDIEKTVTMLYRPPEMADIELNIRNGYEITEQVDMWMIGCILYTLAFYRHPFQDNAFAMAICNAKYFIPMEHPMSKSTKLCGLIHWLLAQSPQDRLRDKDLKKLLAGIGSLKYEDMHASMPQAVRDKIQKTKDLFDGRKDTGDCPMDLMSAKKATADRRAQKPSAASAGARNVAPVPSTGSDMFDVDFERHAPSCSKPSPTGAGAVGAAGTAGAADVQRKDSAQAPEFDLLSFTATPTPTPASASAAQARPPQAAASTLDLFEMGAAPTVAPAAAAPTRASPSSDLLDLGFDLGPATSNASPAPAFAPTPVASTEAWCAFPEDTQPQQQFQQQQQQQHQQQQPPPQQQQQRQPSLSGGAVSAAPFPMWSAQPPMFEAPSPLSASPLAMGTAPQPTFSTGYQSSAPPAARGGATPTAGNGSGLSCGSAARAVDVAGVSGVAEGGAAQRLPPGATPAQVNAAAFEANLFNLL